MVSTRSGLKCETPPHRLSSSSGSYDRHRHSTTTPKPHHGDRVSPHDLDCLGQFVTNRRRVPQKIQNLNLEVALHSMLLVLCPDKFVDRLCKKSPSSIDELCKRAKDHIQREEMSKFWNEVGQKRDKCEAHTKPNLHKLDKRHKPNKREPFPKGLRYPFGYPRHNIEDTTKYCRYHCGIGHNIKDYRALKDKIEELIQASYVAQFVKRPDNHQV
ncbi:hypothetical protein GmHk_U059732 [Glycine max]|nr:hypothetical protein GmHk_U059732 [Glycine max]